MMLQALYFPALFSLASLGSQYPVQKHGKDIFADQCQQDTFVFHGDFRFLLKQL